MPLPSPPEPSRPTRAPTGMDAPAEIAMTPEARQTLLDHLARDEKAALIRIDVGRG